MDLDGHLVHVEFEDVEDSTSDEDDTEVPRFVFAIRDVRLFCDLAEPKEG